MNAAEPESPPGFREGFSALFSGLRLLAETPALWPWALVPTLIFLVLEGLFVTLAFVSIGPFVLELLPQTTSDLGRFAGLALSYGAAVAVAILGWFIAAALAAPLSAPALEHIVERVEQDLKAPPRVPLGVLRELVCGFRSLLGAFLLGTPIIVVLWLLKLFVPGAALVTVPAHLILTSLLVSWGLFDYPLTLRGVGFRERLKLVGDHFPCVLGFGLAFSLLFWFPCCGVVLLPVGAAAATRLVLEIRPP